MAPALVAAAIFVGSHQPASGLPSLAGIDKLLHSAVHALCGWTLLPPVARPWLALLIASAYGVSDELHQAFVPGREPSVADWIADSLGGAAGVWLRTRRSPVARPSPPA